mmetsp:Transcript_128597/g.191606  ORF Transcript_128597/g.191606 Transcript_128597/m.191606 type:complete len:132 (+) Transcript_128597:24-419(+)
MVVSAADAFLRIARRSPVTVTSGVLGSSLLFGCGMFSLLEKREEDTSEDKLITLEEARLRAMIEDAQASDWRENLNKAAQAQEKFMLPDRNGNSPEFMKRIDQRSREMMKHQLENTCSRRKKKQEDEEMGI